MKPSTVCLPAADLRQLLSGDLPQSESAAAEEHLADCDACRSSIERMIADSRWWDDARSSLAADADVSNNFRELAPDAEHETTAQLLALLGPTDDPAMLGRIGTYEIVGLLGRGGMGAVFKGYDAALSRFVAIKMLLPHLAASGAARKRFAREAQAAAAVVDDHVMAIHGVSEWNSVPYFVMPYSRGVSLQKRLDKDGPLEVKEILRIGMQAAKGLAAAHAQGLVHRDVKPANIFLDEGVERVQLMDFGLARAVDDASMTRTGVIAGTPQFMSPEQARGESIDHRSDLFSLGSVLYAMCTGHAPFRAETSYGVLRRITDDAPRPIREINSDIPEWMEAFVMKLLSKSADDRFESAKQVAELLEECLAHAQQPTAVALPAVVGNLKTYATPYKPRHESGQGTREEEAKPRDFLRKFGPAPPTRLIVLAIGMPLIIAATALIVFELNKGTLRIETNSAQSVAIRITQGDEVVEELTVTKAGKTIRLSAGNYVVEIDGDANNFAIEGEQVTLSRRGEWFARVIYAANSINNDVATVKEGTQKPVRDGAVDPPARSPVKGVTGQYPTGLQFVLPNEFRLASRIQERSPKLTLNSRTRRFVIVHKDTQATACFVDISAVPSPTGQANELQRRPARLVFERDDIATLRTVQFLLGDHSNTDRLLIHDVWRLTKSEQARRIATVDFIDPRAAVPLKISDNLWGPANEGLRLAATPESLETQTGQVLDVKLIIENTTDAEVTFERWPSPATVEVRGSAHDQLQTIPRSPRTNFAGGLDKVRLASGERVVLSHVTLQVVEKEEANASGYGPDVLIVDSRAFEQDTARYQIRFSQIVRINRQRIELSSAAAGFSFSLAIPINSARKDANGDINGPQDAVSVFAPDDGSVSKINLKDHGVHTQQPSKPRSIENTATPSSIEDTDIKDTQSGRFLCFVEAEPPTKDAVPKAESLRVRAAIGKDMIQLVHVGNSASVRMDGVPTKTFSGKVTSVKYVANPPILNGQPGPPFEATITLDAGAESLKPGMTGEVDIVGKAVHQMASLKKLEGTWESISMTSSDVDDADFVRAMGRRERPLMILGD